MVGYRSSRGRVVDRIKGCGSHGPSEWRSTRRQADSQQVYRTQVGMARAAMANSLVVADTVLLHAAAC